MPVKKRIKNIVRTISKTGFSDPSNGLFLNHEVEDYVSQFINQGWNLLFARVTNNSVRYMDRDDQGIEMLYVLFLPDEAS